MGSQETLKVWKQGVSELNYGIAHLNMIFFLLPQWTKMSLKCALVYSRITKTLTRFSELFNHENVPRKIIMLWPLIQSPSFGA